MLTPQILARGIAVTLGPREKKMKAKTDVSKTTYDRDKSEQKIKTENAYRDASCAAIR
jgi:hypothetical protein